MNLVTLMVSIIGGDLGATWLKKDFDDLEHQRKMRKDEFKYSEKESEGAEKKRGIMQFPQPQYLGNKYKFLDWIVSHIPKDAKTVIDAFGGSQTVAYRLKQLNYKVITNDFLNYSYRIGKALIENNKYTLTNNDLKVLFSKNANTQKFNLISNVFTNIFFDEKDANFLDSFRSHICELNPYKRALALTVMTRAMTRKVPLGHFAHTMTFKYRNDEKRIKRNRSLIIPVKDIFLSLLPKYNSAIFDNHKNNIALNYDIFNLNKTADCIYFDPPYCGSHADYQSFYHVLETYCKYWKKDFVNSTNMYYPKRISHFTKKSEVLQSFKKIFKKFQNIKYWLISYNNNSYPDINTLTNIISQYKNPIVFEKEYKNSVGGKGSIKGSSEILILCN